MDILYAFHDNLLRNVKNNLFRYLLDAINWEQRMLAIKGPRGSGKTTLMLQYIRYKVSTRPSTSLHEVKVGISL